ncbi:TonB-dependent receptor domain-containing protein [Tichowtungia aerotolerans]|uniref:TonB-dependent receptor n=1 Tax=Tichowtungia aerotolerans TaxID=2697043 RepID=A0A6P1M7R9_9BACT|nr:TonB-dependent receptor [Tichowtungia aerotolerans]QHI68584.1 TonB-dependent receptor [Tichowtungia aerotolerans]
MKNISVTTLSVILAALWASATETNSTPVITVTASAQTADSAAIHDVLKAEPGVLLNSRGGSQNDLSIRGSSFSGAGLSLGGMTLHNPQTEHFNAELPVPAAMLSRPSVRTGLGNQGGHLVGTVGFDLLPMSGTKQFEAGFGTDHRDWQSLLVQQMVSETLGVGFFAGRESASGVDYPDNDYDREYIGGHMQFHKDDTQVDLLISHQEKDFGARGYYGVPDNRAANELTEENMVLLSAMRGDVNADYLRGGISWREFYDDYYIPSWMYENHHRSRVSSAFFDGRTIAINGFALGWHSDVSEERTASTGVGWNHRTRGGISLLPQWSGDRLKLTAGMRGEFFTDISPEYLPQLGAEYMLSDNLTTFASYAESVRLPSYTELNYTSPSSLGNAGLGPQTSQQTEIGFKGIPSESMDWKLSAFYRRSKNTIDWQKLDANSTLWNATDIGSLDTFGTEARLGWYPAQNLEMQVAYTWIYKDKDAADSGNYASLYALDYPEHLVQVSALWKPVERVELGTVQTFRFQADNNIREHGSVGTDSSFVVRYTPPKVDFATISLLVNNAWDDDFQVFPGQRSAGRYAGISLALNW